MKKDEKDLFLQGLQMAVNSGTTTIPNAVVEFILEWIENIVRIRLEEERTKNQIPI